MMKSLDFGDDAYKRKLQRIKVRSIKNHFQFATVGKSTKWKLRPLKFLLIIIVLGSFYAMFSSPTVCRHKGTTSFHSVSWPKITLGAYFVDGPAGSGKTFLYRALLAAARSRHFIALAVASSGVAASLLPGGRTAHSRFKLPIIVEDEACTISKQSVHARVIVAAKLIIWDEASVMVLEPSNCTFKLLMDHINEIESYNGGDQGYLNEIFTWWHGIPKHMNFLKHFWVGDDEVVRKKKIHLFEAEPPVLYVLHYLGNKPWMCFKDYDCNWNVNILQEFASDAAHRRWWKVHDEMPERLKEHCLLKTLQKAQLEWDIREAEKGNYSDGHWRIGIKDERLMRCIDKDCSWRGKLRHWVVKNPPHSATVSAAAYLSPKRAGLYANFV